jgi:putative aldouronate transport system substrate-binding protein
MSTLNDSFAKAGDTKSIVRELPIMKGPYGDQFHMYPDVPVLSGGMIITSVSKYQTELAKWADYWYSDVGQSYMMGIENVTYTKNEKGEPKYTDIIKKNPQGKNLNEARGLYTFGSSVWPSVFVPWSVTADMFAAYIEEGRLKNRKPELQVMPMPIGLSFTLAENTRNAQVMTDVDLTVDESITNFIIGKTPLNDTTWNEYVAKLKKIGLDDVIKNQQAAVDRYNKR